MLLVSLVTFIVEKCQNIFVLLKTSVGRKTRMGVYDVLFTNHVIVKLPFQQPTIKEPEER